MSTTRKQDVLSNLGHRALELRRLQEEPATRQLLGEAGLTPEALARADANHDGKLDAAEAWRLADRFDHDGKPDTLVSLDAAGQPTAAARALGALGQVFEEVQPPAPAAADTPRLSGGELVLPEPFLARMEAAHGPAARARFTAWRQLVHDVKALPERERLQQVNEFFNCNVTYTPEPGAGTRGAVDHWQAPLETLGLGTGDCEDYALAKAATLRMVGFPEDRVDVALVRHATAGMHAVTVVRDGGGAPWVLDNMEWDALRANGRTELAPLALVSPARIQQVDGAWNPVGPAKPPETLTRYVSALEATRALLGG